jgi:predicted nucleotidyltransferase
VKRFNDSTISRIFSACEIRRITDLYKNIENKKLDDFLAEFNEINNAPVINIYKLILQCQEASEDLIKADLSTFCCDKKKELPRELQKITSRISKMKENITKDFVSRFFRSKLEVYINLSNLKLSNLAKKVGLHQPQLTCLRYGDANYGTQRWISLLESIGLLILQNQQNDLLEDAR